MAKSKAIVKRNQETRVEILTAEEMKKIDKAVEFINQQANSTAKSLISIGQYLLNEFFDGDIRKAEDRAPRKGISLRKIADSKDISLSFMSLSNSIRLAAQESLFNDSKYSQLTETHKLLLFGLPDDKTKKLYAEKAVTDNLSVRAFRDLLTSKQLIAARGRTTGTKGTRVTDPFDKFFSPIEKLISFDFTSFNEKELTKDRITALTELRDRIDELLAKVPK